MRRLTLSNSSKIVQFLSRNFTKSTDDALIVGHNQKCIRDCEVFKVTTSDFAGSFDDIVLRRASAGGILSFLDTCGGRTAISFLVGYNNQDRDIIKKSVGVTIATVSFNAFMFRRPVYMGDLVVVQGSVIYAGKSSLGIHLNVERQGYDARTPSYVGECYLTMVCVSPMKLDTVVKDVVPALRLTSKIDKERYQLYTAIRDIQKKTKEATREKIVDGRQEIIEDDVNRDKPIKVPISETTTYGNRAYSPADVNFNNAIFGGAILRWMEEHACHCGRVFTGNPHVYTIGMHNMLFDRPIFYSDSTSLEARVVYVRHTTMEVDVDIVVERDGSFVTSNRASFVLISMDEKGNKVPIPKGIDLKNSSAEHLKDYLKARIRYYTSLEVKQQKTPL
ncbi:ATP-binding protein Cassette (ABC) superfamily [Trypanosoma theileri]|uniref:ATP-binding protein Cassette (ABC) superfamily n=1 Tax=Trypanosoma theileri TaxID=67003 RepID=A0A1X0P0I5_9TRYP|nr:ATP-binding protein Cassette (ABC) superfamily [Trypanosoma theileri]ORC90233.1 ATP-binding protein Cassette (ABC) superfamily [Trypanosoma theileri]